MTDELDILVDEDGDIHFVYSDELAPAFASEEQTTRRASHVEPANAVHVDTEYKRLLGGHVQAIRTMAGRSGWAADMRPSGGPVLLAPDGDGFATRQEALDAEREWLRRERGL